MLKNKWFLMDAAGDGDGGGAPPVPPTPPIEPPAPPTPPIEPPPTPPSGDAPTPPAWDDGWREKIAGTDEKLLKRLERYPSVKAATDALVEAQTKISKGDIQFPLKENATPEEVTAWRKENNIPEKYSDYDVGIVDAKNKDFVESFMKMAHDNNFAPEKVKSGAAWLISERERITEEIQDRDAERAEATDETMRAEWGPDYKPNNNAIVNLVSKYGNDEFAHNLFGARLGNGVALKDDPAALRFLATIAREINPIGTIMPGSGTNPIQAAESRIAELATMSGDLNSAYHDGSAQSKALKTEHLKLIEATQKQRSR